MRTRLVRGGQKCRRRDLEHRGGARGTGRRSQEPRVGARGLGVGPGSQKGGAKGVGGPNIQVGGVKGRGQVQGKSEGALPSRNGPHVQAFKKSGKLHVGGKRLVYDSTGCSAKLDRLPLHPTSSAFLENTFDGKSETWKILSRVAGLCNRANFKPNQEKIPISQVPPLPRTPSLVPAPPLPRVLPQVHHVHTPFASGTQQATPLSQHCLSSSSRPAALCRI